jgi:glycosyltransferase involved in cell wall biosynthesis
MKIQVLVNHYQEDENIIKRFLNSLEKQEDVEFEVIIGSDGGLQISQELLSSYSFPITYLYLSHSGVCHTRNVLFNKSNAEYVMFCDIDDMFFRSYGLNHLLSTAEETEANIIGSVVLQEMKDNT